MMQPDFEKCAGLVPAIVQHDLNGTVLMLAYMDQTAWEQTLATGQATFYSRSRKQLWVKGETSGNTLTVVSTHLDCDRDTILLKCLPAGPSCHLDLRSCFDVEGDQGPMLDRLAGTVRSRAESQEPGSSYTRKLLDAGIQRVAQKVGEEAVETVVAAVAGEQDEVISESADLLYHLMVLWQASGTDMDSVLAELSDRHGD